MSGRTARTLPRSPRSAVRFVVCAPVVLFADVPDRAAGSVVAFVVPHEADAAFEGERPPGCPWRAVGVEAVGDGVAQPVGEPLDDGARLPHPVSSPTCPVRPL